MVHPVTDALHQFSERYMQKWSSLHQSLPVSEELVGIDSPCIQEQKQGRVFWQPVKNVVESVLLPVENGIEIALHEDIHAFYGSQYSADMTARFQSHDFTLLQVWNEDDLTRLQENILGHLVTQRRLKLKPTVFIGTTDSEWDVISICNLTGQVLLEHLGTKNREILAASVAEFLDQTEPEV